MDAHATLQEALDRMSAACMHNDWPTFRDGVRLPFVLVTADLRTTVPDEVGLRQGFDTFVQMLQVRKVTDYIRTVHSAAFAASDVLTGSYESHLLCHAERVVPPYTSDARMERIDGRWRFAEIANNWTNDRWPVITPVPGDPEAPRGRPDR